jgi:hypothetical protein
MFHPFPNDRESVIERVQQYVKLEPLFLDTETTGLSAHADAEMTRQIVLHMASQKMGGGRGDKHMNLLTGTQLSFLDQESSDGS